MSGCVYSVAFWFCYGARGREQKKNISMNEQLDHSFMHEKIKLEFEIANEDRQTSLSLFLLEHATHTENMLIFLLLFYFPLFDNNNQSPFFLALCVQKPTMWENKKKV